MRRTAFEYNQHLKQEKILKLQLQHCPYRQDLKIYCGEKDCTRADCPIWNKESGILAQAIEYNKGG